MAKASAVSPSACHAARLRLSFGLAAHGAAAAVAWQYYKYCVNNTIRSINKPS